MSGSGDKLLFQVNITGEVSADKVAEAMAVSSDLIEKLGGICLSGTFETNVTIGGVNKKVHMGADRIRMPEGVSVRRISSEGDRMPELQELGKIIRDRRLELGLRQKDVSKPLGYTDANLSRLERADYQIIDGKQNGPSAAFIYGIAASLELPVEDLLILAGYELTTESSNIS